MIKLSQKAWNNVIIISMLILIVVFNSTSNLLNGESSADETTPLLAQSAQITTLDFGDYKVERIGQGWRVVGKQATSQQLQSLLNAWHSAELETLSSSVSLSEANQHITVSVWLIGQPQPLKFELFQFEQVTVVNNGRQLLQLRQPSFDALSLEENQDA